MIFVERHFRVFQVSILLLRYVFLCTVTLVVRNEKVTGTCTDNDMTTSGRSRQIQRGNTVVGLRFMVVLLWTSTIVLLLDSFRCKRQSWRFLTSSLSHKDRKIEPTVEMMWHPQTPNISPIASQDQQEHSKLYYLKNFLSSGLMSLLITGLLGVS